MTTRLGTGLPTSTREIFGLGRIELDAESRPIGAAWAPLLLMRMGS
jgi:hypothetical protein